MGITAIQEKYQYNKTLVRWKKYEAFVDNPSISMDEKIKWAPQAKKLVDEMGRLLAKIKDAGHDYTEKEVLETGFEV